MPQRTIRPPNTPPAPPRQPAPARPPARPARPPAAPGALLAALACAAALAAPPLTATPQHPTRAQPDAPASAVQPSDGQAPAVHPIATIDPAAPTTDDLLPIDRAIGDARIVWLLERHPGDGAALLAKARLVDHLVLHHNFKVILWESSLADCRAMDTVFADGLDMSRGARIGLPPHWALSGHTQPVLRRVWMSYFGDEPVALAGFGVQSFGEPRGRPWTVEALKVLDAAGTAPTDAEARRAILDLAEDADLALDQQDAEGMVRVWDALTILRDQLAAAHAALPADAMDPPYLPALLARAAGDKLAEFEAAMAGLPTPNTLRALSADADRMRDNLLFLADTVFPSQRLIIWSRAWWAMNDPASIRFAPANAPDNATATPAQSAAESDPPAPADNPLRTVLSTWPAERRHEIYTLALTAHDGTFALPGLNTPEPIEATAEGGLEARLRAAHPGPFAFMDYRAPASQGGAPDDLRGPMPGKLAGQNAFLPPAPTPAETIRATADWSRQVDGVLFIRTMFPNTADGRIPVGATLRAE